MSAESIQGPNSLGTATKRAVRPTPDYRFKRLIDIIISLAGLILFAPVFAVLAVVVAATSRGPIFYRSPRVGRHGEPFECLKFRTMVANAEERLAALFDSRPELLVEYERTLKLKVDPRVTRIGRFLRKTSLDELPQFWNVLLGEMSVVGPRPLLPNEPPKYGDALDEVLSVRPGLTGPWQVSGRNDLSYATRVQLAREYARRPTLPGDLRIILRTPLVMLTGNETGAY